MKPYIPTRPQLIQNALFFPERDFYLISTHHHDYREYEYDDQFTAMVDGGLDYVRRTITPASHAHLVRDWCLYDVSPREEVLNRLLWGSLPLDKSQPQEHTYRPIRLLTKDHLAAILANVPQINPLHGEVIEYWLLANKG